MALKLIRRSAGAECTSILSELPDWFGIPESNAAYAAAAEQGPTWIADEADETIGVMVLRDTGFSAIDIHLLAVRPHRHRQGVGRALVEEALAYARMLGKHLLTVKTQGPSAGYEAYERTRAFYEGMGFLGLEEFTQIWGPENPCLIMARTV